jgi:hypothetical protein
MKSGGCRRGVGKRNRRGEKSKEGLDTREKYRGHNNKVFQTNRHVLYL